MRYPYVDYDLKLYAYKNNDALREGTDCNEIFIGGGGKDTLIGNGGNDTLYGGNSPDELWGGEGNDVLNGGASPDLFIFAPGQS
ncbi:MAG: hypothetical protein ACO331_10940 [Prochlorothrix sp.]